MDYMWHAFVSYNTRDREKAEYIVNDLKKSGLKIWFDQERVLAGHRIRSNINEAIKRSRSVIILLSSNSLKSNWVLNELDSAMLREIEENISLVIPILTGKLQLDHLPADLRGKKFLDMRYNFTSRYREYRSLLVTSILLSSRKIDDSYEKIPFGDYMIQKIMSYPYFAMVINGVPFKKIIDIFFDAFLEDSLWEAFAFDESQELESDPSDNKGMNFREFVKEYGEWGGRQLVGFLFITPQTTSTR